MKRTVNSYLGMLFITVVGAGAALLIINTADRVAVEIDGMNAASYSSFQEAVINTTD